MVFCRTGGGSPGGVKKTMLLFLKVFYNCIHVSPKRGLSENRGENTIASQPLDPPRLKLIANTRLQHLGLCSLLLTNMFLTGCRFSRAGVMYGTNQHKCRLPEKYLVTFVAPSQFVQKTQNLKKKKCDSHYTGVF